MKRNKKINQRNHQYNVGDQQRIANHIGGTMIGGGLQTITSSYGHDGFLIERDLVGPLLIQLLES